MNIEKPVDNWKKEDFFSKFKNKYPDISKKNEQKKLLKSLIIKVENN